MRILFLTSTFEPLTGGAETYALLLTSALAEAGHSVTIITDGAWLEDLPPVAIERGCRVLRLRSYLSSVERRDKVLWRQMQFAPLEEIDQLIANEKFDVVHANSHETLVWALPIAESMGAALVASLHEQNPDASAFGDGRCTLAYKTFPVDMHLAASGFYEARARQYGVEDSRLRRVYHGVQPDIAAGISKHEAREDLGIPHSTYVLVCPARVYERKGQVYLAKAFIELRKRFPDAHLLLAGRVSDVDYAKKVFEILKGASDDGTVTHLENLSLADMPTVFAASDVAVMPSLEEGLGLAAIEAMQFGLPVIASNVSGLAEVIQHNVDGLLVPPRDPTAVVRAVVQVREDEQSYREFARAGRETVAKRFSVNVMRDETLEAYRVAMKNRRKRSGA